MNLPMQTRSHHRRRTELLALSPRARARVTFIEDDDAHQSLAGKTFLVERVGTDLEVKTDAGQNADPGETARIRKEMSSFGKADDQLVVPQRPIRPGERVPELERQLSAKLAEGNTLQVASVTVHAKELRDIGGDACAVFAFDAIMELGKKGFGFGFEMELHGEFAVRQRDGWEVMVEATGPLRAQTPDFGLGDAGVAIEGGGSLRVTFRASYP